MSSTGQQYYPSHPLRRNDRNPDRVSGDIPGNDRHPYRSSGHGGLHGIPGMMMVVPLLNLMEVVEIVLPILNLESGVGMTDALNSMLNFNKVLLL